MPAACGQFRPDPDQPVGRVFDGRLSISDTSLEVPKMPKVMVALAQRRRVHRLALHLLLKKDALGNFDDDSQGIRDLIFKNLKSGGGLYKRKAVRYHRQYLEFFLFQKLNSFFKSAGGTF